MYRPGKGSRSCIKKYATYNHPEYGTIYAFEVDGFGNHFLMDDANVPSLLAMPYLGDVDINDPIYQTHAALYGARIILISSKEKQEKVLGDLTSVMTWYGL